MKYSGRKRKIGKMFRAPKTTAERRANQDETAVFGRRRDVPSAWDDIHVDRSDRNWKKFRKTKWK